MNKLLIAVAPLFLLGCAHQSAVMPLADGDYMVVHQGHSFLAQMPKIRRAALQDASTHCEIQGKEPAIVRFDDVEGPYIAGNFPGTTLIFRCQ